MSILLLKWSAKSSHRASVGTPRDLLKSAFINGGEEDLRVVFMVSKKVFKMGNPCLFDCYIV